MHIAYGTRTAHVKTIDSTSMHVHAVGGALYCGLVHMLARATNDFYLMFSLCCTMYMRYIQ